MVAVLGGMELVKGTGTAAPHGPGQIVGTEIVAAVHGVDTKPLGAGREALDLRSLHRLQLGLIEVEGVEG